MRGELKPTAAAGRKHKGPKGGQGSSRRPQGQASAEGLSDNLALQATRAVGELLDIARAVAVLVPRPVLALARPVPVVVRARPVPLAVVVPRPVAVPAAAAAVATPVSVAA